jgi:hypothetical protein
VGFRLRVRFLRQQASAATGNKKLYFDELAKFVDNIKLANIFVCSLTEVADLLSQWRGYCSVGTGYSIGFDSEKLLERARKQNFLLGACEYSDSGQRQMFLKLGPGLLDQNDFRPENCSEIEIKRDYRDSLVSSQSCPPA